MSGKNDYIVIGGKDYRVEFNWNAITEFLESEGLGLGDVDNLKQLKPKQVTGLIHAGVVEGCRLDGMEFPVSKLDFGSMIGPKEVGDLMLIYVRQTNVEKSGAEENVQKKSWKSRLLLNGSSK